MKINTINAYIYISIHLCTHIFVYFQPFIYIYNIYIYIYIYIYNVKPYAGHIRVFHGQGPPFPRKALAKKEFGPREDRRWLMTYLGLQISVAFLTPNMVHLQIHLDSYSINYQPTLSWYLAFSFIFPIFHGTSWNLSEI